MFLDLAHTTYEVFKVSKLLTLECYKITKAFPAEEKFGMIQQIRRAALSVYLNIAEGFSRKSAVERRRFFEIARGSVIEIDAAIDIALDLQYRSNCQLEPIGELMIKVFKQLTGLIQSLHRCDH